ncbi:histone-lysine N-methyltransferase SETMAR [Plakobranchus ocellatus]|uniref:Histone-lysine N-methyltransferase SETMAR n=1 Tax=Plakobranchus ocellatus TaxID=259542 RepID=A0AAV4DSD4_9GAST|nr:histone-lysine N-methyltransferase SETMAR [Plakobranchus ocellatus]
MSMTQVYQWCSWFKDSQTSLQDEPSSGRPNTANNDWNTARVDELIKLDRRVNLKEISLKLDVPKTNVMKLSVINLAIAKFLPDGNKLLEHIITGDETWLHLSTPETKPVSMTWKHPSFPVTKEFKVQQSATKVMATVFWNSRKTILLDILLKGESVNADRYCETLDGLRHAVRRKRPGLLRNGVVLQYYNATPHTPKHTKKWLERYRWDIIPYPAHSPDLAPLDFHLFGPLKRHLGGKKFEDEDELIGEVRDWFSKLDTNFFTEGIYLLLPR